MGYLDLKTRILSVQTFRILGLHLSFLLGLGDYPMNYTDNLLTCTHSPNSAL